MLVVLYGSVLIKIISVNILLVHHKTYYTVFPKSPGTVLLLVNVWSLNIGNSQITRAVTQSQNKIIIEEWISIPNFPYSLQYNLICTECLISRA